MKVGSSKGAGETLGGAVFISSNFHWRLSSFKKSIYTTRGRKPPHIKKQMNVAPDGTVMSHFALGNVFKLLQSAGIFCARHWSYGTALADDCIRPFGPGSPQFGSGPFPATDLRDNGISCSH